MTSIFVRTALGVAMALAATSTHAQESTNRVATLTDWSVFTEENPKECWGVSSPKETVNTKDGKPVQVRVTQGKEPAHFRQLFKGKMIVFRGE